MQQTVEVANVMCDGCAGKIKRELTAIDGVSAVQVDVASGKVSFDAAADQGAAVKARLGAIGYPEKAATSDLAALVARAKTYAG